jgi:hypothetical protein
MSIFRTSLLSIRKPSQQQVQSNGSPPRWAIDVACVTALVVYFLHFALPAVAGNLNEDEMPELWRYWYHGPLKWLWANICFWTPAPFYRPGGRVLLLAALSFFWPSSSTLSNRPDCHSRCVDSDALLFERVSRLLSLDRMSSYSCSMLSPWANQPGVYRFVQL